MRSSALETLGLGVFYCSSALLGDTTRVVDSTEIGGQTLDRRGFAAWPPSVGVRGRELS
jgi:hypothetical protein